MGSVTFPYLYRHYAPMDVQWQGEVEDSTSAPISVRRWSQSPRFLRLSSFAAPVIYKNTDPDPKWGRYGLLSLLEEHHTARFNPDIELTKGEPLMMLLISKVYHSVYGDGHGYSPNMVFLILRALDPDETVFERVGFMWLDEGGSDLWIVKALEQDGAMKWVQDIRIR
jgi:hypothetical protein